MAIQTAMENINIFNFEATSLNFGKLFKEIRAGNSCSIFGVQNSARPAFVSGFNKKLFYVAADAVTARAVQENFELMGKNALIFPAIQDSFIYKKAMSSEFYEQRTNVLFNVLNKNFDVVIASVDSLFSYLPSVSAFSSHILKIKTNQVIEPEKLQQILVEAGYKKEEIISEKGQFSRRGEIIDIFPINMNEPYRIDFFDNLVESIKVFDVATQKGTKKVDYIKICPHTDLFLTNDELEFLKNEVLSLKKLEGENVDKNTIFNAGIDEIISRIDLKDRSYALDVLAPFLQDFRSSIFDYLDVSLKEDYLVVFDECKQLYDAMQTYSKETDERIKELYDDGTLISKSRKIGFSFNEVLANFETKHSVAFLKITNSNRFFNSKAVFNFKTLAGARYTHNLKDFSIDVKSYLAKGYKVFVFAGNDEQARSAENLLKAHDIDIEINKKATINNESSILMSGYSSGFILPEEKIVIVGTYDIFQKNVITMH